MLANMAIVTFPEAATVLGFKSRSTHYRLRDQGDLASYLRPPASTGGAPRLELEPLGLPPLRLHVERNVRPQVSNVQRHTRIRIDPRWEEVADALTAELTDAGGLLLSAAEAKAIAAALPDASADGFGESGPELLRADVYPRIESGNAATAKPPRLLNVLRGKILEVWGHFSQSKTLRQSRLSATCRWCDSRRLTARLTVME